MASDSLRFLDIGDSQVDCTCDILNKELSSRTYVSYMLDRTVRMFRYKNLPKTIPAYMLELMLQCYGSVLITEVNGNLYCFRANFGGSPDPYYRPTHAVVANPALGVSFNARLVNYFPPFNRIQWDKMQDGVRFLSDSLGTGLLPMFSRYASQMTENDISIRSSQINTRQQVTICATDGPEYESAQLYVHSLEQGKIAVIGKRPFLEGIDVKDLHSSDGNTIIQLIELQQYLKASWYNEIGLNSNFNMKRQYMSADEIQSSSDIMLPLVDNMLHCREEAVEFINEHWGTDISVEKDSAWAHKQLLSDMSLLVENPAGVEPMKPIDETEILEDENNLSEEEEKETNSEQSEEKEEDKDGSTSSES